MAEGCRVWEPEEWEDTAESYLEPTPAWRRAGPILIRAHPQSLAEDGIREILACKFCNRGVKHQMQWTRHVDSRSHIRRFAVKAYLDRVYVRRLSQQPPPPQGAGAPPELPNVAPPATSVPGAPR